MKILFLTGSLEYRGGLERVVSIIASQIAQKNTVDIGLVSLTSKIAYEINDDINIIPFERCLRKRNLWGIIRKICRKSNLQLFPWLAKKTFYTPRQIQGLEYYINEGLYDCVIAVGPDLPLLLSLVKRGNLKNKNIKLIAWHHNTYEAYYYEKGKYAFGRERLAQNSLSRLDKVVTLTKHDADILHRKLGVNSTYIYNPLGFSTSVKTKLDTKTILFVGRLDIKQKGIDFLLEIARKIFSDNRSKGWSLLLVGDGKDRNHIEQMIRNQKLAERVHCVGDQENVIPYYLNADILLSTSRWEGFGMVITEAFECGLPVVSFINNGPSEIISDGENGYLIKRFDVQLFAEKVLELMEDDEKRICFSRCAQQRARDFSVDNIMGKWDGILGL